MYIIKPLPEFDDWLNALKDKATRVRLIKRLGRVAAGNLGDVKSVGDGDKATQQVDIETSKKLAGQLSLPIVVKE